MQRVRVGLVADPAKATEIACRFGDVHPPDGDTCSIPNPRRVTSSASVSTPSATTLASECNANIAPSDRLRERALRFAEDAPCPECHSGGLRPEALAVTFVGTSIAEVSDLSLAELVTAAATVADLSAENHEVAVRICADLIAGVVVLLDLGPATSASGGAVAQ